MSLVGEAAAPRRRAGRLVMVVVAVTVIAAGGTVAAVTLLNRADSPQATARQAGQAIAAAGGVTLTGSLVGISTARLTVTRAGTVTGTYTQDGGKVTRITIAGTTFLNAPETFWTDRYPSGSAPGAGGRWALATPGDVLSMNSFIPGQLASALEHVGPHPREEAAVLGGVPVMAITSGGVTYDVTAARPHRLVRVSASSGGTVLYAFSARALTAAAARSVLAALRAQVPVLGRVADPAADASTTRPSFGACDLARCVVADQTTVPAVGPVGPGTRLQMILEFLPGPTAPAFTTCSSPATPIRPSVPVTLRCAGSGAAYQRWTTAHPGGRFYVQPTFTVISNVAALRADLAR